jgi:hypothetical protein
MKTEGSPFKFLTLIVMHTLMFSAAAEPSGEVSTALKHAGENCGELETALRKVKGKDTEYLICHASQYDLVNLTAQQIIENVTYARKVHQDLPYLGGKLSDEMWRKWVLPHRVMEEGLCLWRKDFYELIQPVVEDKKTTAEAAEAIRFWLWQSGGDGGLKVRMGSAEYRLRSSKQLVDEGVGACGEIALTYVSFLRAAGIPARHASTGWFAGKDYWHFFTEYWDAQKKAWVGVDDNPTTPREHTRSGKWAIYSAYAYPSFPRESDLYYKLRFSELINITADVSELAPIEIEGDGAANAACEAAMWNSMGWCAAAVPSEAGANGRAKFALAKLAKEGKFVDRPVLFTTVNKGVLQWGLVRPSSGVDVVRLVNAVPGKCLKWEAHKVQLNQKDAILK